MKYLLVGLGVVGGLVAIECLSRSQPHPYQPETTNAIPRQQVAMFQYGLLTMPAARAIGW